MTLNSCGRGQDRRSAAQLLAAVIRRSSGCHTLSVESVPVLSEGFGLMLLLLLAPMV